MSCEKEFLFAPLPLFFVPLPLVCVPATCTLDPNKEGLYQQSWAWSVRNGTEGKQEKLYTDKTKLVIVALVTAQRVMVYLHMHMHSTVHIINCRYILEVNKSCNWCNSVVGGGCGVGGVGGPKAAPIYLPHLLIYSNHTYSHPMDNFLPIRTIFGNHKSFFKL